MSGSSRLLPEGGCRNWGGALGVEVFFSPSERECSFFFFFVFAQLDFSKNPNRHTQLSFPYQGLCHRNPTNNQKTAVGTASGTGTDRGDLPAVKPFYRIKIGRFSRKIMQVPCKILQYSVKSFPAELLANLTQGPMGKI